MVWGERKFHWFTCWWLGLKALVKCEAARTPWESLFMSMWFFFPAQPVQVSWMHHTESHTPNSGYQGEDISQNCELRGDHLWNAHAALASRYVYWSSPGPPSRFKEGSSSLVPMKLHTASLERCVPPPKAHILYSLSQDNYFAFIYFLAKANETRLLFYGYQSWRIAWE